MKIIWNENPLKTVIELDETEKLLFREKYKTQYLIEECIYAAYCELASQADFRGKTPEERIKRAVADLKAEYVADDAEDGKFESFIDRQMGYYLPALSEEHEGDCTKVAYSCTKCHAEGIWGVYTIKGLNRGAYRVSGAFRAEGATLNTVISALATYEPGPKPDTWPDAVGWESHHPRWKADAQHAHDWLVKYRADHF